MAPIAIPAFPPARIHHQMSDDEIADIIAERTAQADMVPAGELRQQILAEVARLKSYLAMKQLLRPKGPRLTA